MSWVIEPSRSGASSEIWLSTNRLWQWQICEQSDGITSESVLELGRVQEHGGTSVSLCAVDFLTPKQSKHFSRWKLMRGLGNWTIKDTGSGKTPLVHLVPLNKRIANCLAVRNEGLGYGGPLVFVRGRGNQALPSFLTDQHISTYQWHQHTAEHVVLDVTQMCEGLTEVSGGSALEWLKFEGKCVDDVLELWD